MYTAQIIKERVQERQRALGIKNLEDFLKKAGTASSTFYSMSDKRGISAFKLAQIADALGTSVDYLLGRSDSPEISVSVDNTQATITAQQTNAGIIIADATAEERDLLALIRSLTLFQRSRLIVEAEKMLKEETSDAKS